MANKWNDERLEAEIRSFMEEYGLTIFPSSSVLGGRGRSDLANGVSRSGGFVFCSKKFDIPGQNKTPRWSLEKIELELLSYITEKELTHLPSKPDLIKDGRCDICNAMTRHKSMKYWSDRVGYPLKESETTTGNKFERIVSDYLILKGYHVDNMVTKHPYDLLVEGNIKIDVKVSSPHNHFGTRSHTFRSSKECPTCDVYVCVALDEEKNPEDIYVIPSTHAKIVTINISGMGGSKYEKFKNNWDVIREYTKLYSSLINKFPV